MSRAAPIMPHQPVLLTEVLENLQPHDGGVYVDGTFGAGGYTAAILDAANCTVIAIDRDPSVGQAVRALKEKYGERFIFMRGCFGDVAEILKAVNISEVDGFVLDIGVSSMQLDEAGRGFSFRFDGPLDMRMDSEAGETAADLVNSLPEEDLANIIYKYGEERKSRRIAKAIVLKRTETPFETTTQLADIVRSVIPKSPRDKNDPATRTFQALRIAVNDELGELERALADSPSVLKAGGRLVVVSFHSLEDGIVKEFLKTMAGKSDSVSRYLPVPDKKAENKEIFKILTRKPVMAAEDELAENPRARSAKLRAAVKLEAGA